MADEDPNLNIRATLDSSGVVTGAESATGGIGRIDVAMREAKEIANLYSVSLSTAERALTILSAPIGEATANLAELDAAMDLAQQETRAAATANAAYAKSMTESAAAIMAEGAELEALGGITARTSTTLRALGIETTAVAAKATELGISLEIAALAMIKIQKAELAGTVKDAALAMEGLTVATAEQAAATEASTVMTEADASALAQRAILMRRTSDGLVDLALGGRRAVQGVADLQYVLTTLMPEFAGVLAAVGGVALVLELLTRRHGEAGGAAKGHADAEKSAAEEVKDAWTGANDDLKSQIESLSREKFWSQQLDSAKQVTAEIHAQAAALDMVEAAQVKVLVSVQNLQIARLNLAESEELQGKSGTAATAVRDKYATLRTEAKTTNEEDRQALELKRLQDEKSALIAEQNAKQAEVTAALEDERKAAQKAYEDSLKFDRQLSNANEFGQSDYEYAKAREKELTEKKQAVGTIAPGISPESPGVGGGTIYSPVPPLSIAEQVELNNYQNGGLEDRRKKQVDAGHGIYDEQYDRAKKERDSIEKETEDATKSEGSWFGKKVTPEEIKDLTDRAKALADYMAQVDEYRNLLKQTDESSVIRNKAVIDSQKEAAEQQAKIDAKTLEIRAMTIDQDTTKVQGQADANKDQNQTQSDYGKAVDDNAKDLVRKKKEADEQDKRADDNNFKRQEEPLNAKVEQDRAAIEAFQAAQREMQDHNATVVGMVKQHAQQTTAANAATKAQLDELRAELARDQASVRALEQQHKASITNALN